MFADPNEEESCGEGHSCGGCGKQSETNQAEETKADIYKIGGMLVNLVDQKIRLLQLRHTIYVVLRGNKVFCKVNKPTSAEITLIAFTPDYIKQFVKGEDSLNPTALIEDACEKISMVLAEFTMKGISLFDLSIPEGVGIEGENKN